MTSVWRVKVLQIIPYIPDDEAKHQLKLRYPSIRKEDLIVYDCHVEDNTRKKKLLLSPLINHVQRGILRRNHIIQIQKLTKVFYDGWIVIIEEYENLGESGCISTYSFKGIDWKDDAAILLLSRSELSKLSMWTLDVPTHESCSIIETIAAIQNSSSLDYFMENRNNLVSYPRLTVLVLKKVFFSCKSNSRIANVHLSVCLSVCHRNPQPLRIAPISH